MFKECVSFGTAEGDGAARLNEKREKKDEEEEEDDRCVHSSILHNFSNYFDYCIQNTAARD